MSSEYLYEKSWEIMGVSWEIRGGPGISWQVMGGPWRSWGVMESLEVLGGSWEFLGGSWEFL